MKKIFLALAILSATLVSCEKEVETKNCNCGEIVRWYPQLIFNPDGTRYYEYYIIIKNSCTYYNNKIWINEYEYNSLQPSQVGETTCDYILYQ